MDDCNLEKLGVNPGKLTPAFKRDITEYTITLGSDVDKLALDPLTSDSGASYSIKGAEGSKQVPLKEGAVTDITIEVSAEDGTVKNYIIHAKRLSAKDATLGELKIDPGTLCPEFSPDVLQYTCLLPCNVTNVTVTPTVMDVKCALTLNGKKPGAGLPLNVGETQFDIQVTSADGSNKATYCLTVTKKQLPRYVRLTDPAAAIEFECPISLSPLYCPVTIKGSEPKHTFSAPFIDEFTKLSKFDPLNNVPLEVNWRISDTAIDKNISAASACIPLTNGGVSETKPLGELPSLIEKCNIVPKMEDVKDKFKNAAFVATHTVKVQKWEKELHQIFDESDPNKLTKMAQDNLNHYFQSLPRPGQAKRFAEGASPMDYLHQAACCYACALKTKGKDASLHLHLGFVLEERYYAEDIFGLKKDKDKTEIAGANLEARESSKEEEVLAICKLRGVDASAPVSLQLKAVDEEYHHLVNTGQGGKADHVMALYAWYSKKISQEGAAAQKASDQESPLGQAYQKYLDALTIEEPKAIHNFHVGRLLVIQGCYEDAIKRLEATLAWSAQHQLARLYLGLALALRKEGPKDRTKEAIGYLLESLELLLTANTKQALSQEEQILIGDLFAENLIRTTNVHLLRSIIQLGKLLSCTPDVKDAMSAKDVFHTAALLAAQVLPQLARGDCYKQFEWVLLDAHSALLDILSANPAANEELITLRSERLSALITNATIPQNAQLLELQERTCQRLVKTQPCSSPALCMLGTSQLAKAENSPPGEEANAMLKDAEASFLCAIRMEGKPAAGDAPEQLKGQNWWVEWEKKEEEKKKAAEAKAAPPPAASTPTPAGKPTAGRGAPAGRGGPAGRGAPAPRGKAVPAPAPTGRGGAAARGGAAGGAPAARGGKAGAAPKAAPEVAKQTPPAATQAPAPEPAEEKKEEAPPPKPKRPVPINRKTYQPRLGLARVLRNGNRPEEAQKYYFEVMDMAPEVHDAYIESADMLLKSNPLAAVDVYCKFPVAETPTFDDAYIFGEIVRILMKNEKYEDPRLAQNMISLGKVYGLGVLERHVKILEEKFKSELLQKVYAGVNNKSVDDPDMQNFFRFKCWI